MTVKVPLINGTSYISLTTSDKSLFQETIQFYAQLVKFSVKEESKSIIWLSNDDNVSIKLSLQDSGSSRENIEKNRSTLTEKLNTNDWRSAESSLSLKTSNIEELIEILKHNKVQFQLRPNNLNPVELYTLDPLSNLIGFTTVDNTFTSVTPINVPSNHSKTASTSATTPHPHNQKDSQRRNIGIMTSGGDAPGMNANVRAVVRAAIFRGCKAFAIMEGYEGLVRGGPEYIKEMNWLDVGGWLAEGGTNIGTARCMAFKERKGRLSACKNMIDAEIDALIVCGGDGSLTGADLFRNEWPSLIQELKDKGEISTEKYEKHKHLNICGTVGSIDNDMSTTDATIGAYSSLARICQAIDYIDATANSHSRAFVIEVMGRHCGWLALMAGIATSADYIMIPEKPSSSKDWKEQMSNIVSRHRERGKRKTIVIVAEGAIASDLTPITSKDVLKVLKENLNLDTRITTLGHVQRGGTAVAYDRILATLQGVEAVKAVLDCTPGTPSPLIAIEENKIVRKSLVDAVRLTKSVAEAIENKDFEKAMSLRDSEFVEHLYNFVAMNSADHNDPLLPVEKRKKIAIVNVGAPAGGMNSAVYSMATYCMYQGHTPYAIHNGFPGLARHESVRSIDWLTIEGWTSLGGSEIGTNRTTPEEADIGMIAYYFEKYGFDGLILVGGFEAFISLHQLQKARTDYPAFRIPMVLIPATISNNVPGTEYSIGSDTCLNSLMEYCDVVKQSAAASRDRVFIVEVQGGNSGYIATYAALATGADASYVPEEGISLNQLELDVATLQESFKRSKGKANSGKLILKSANASKVLTTQVLADIFVEESNGRYDAKTAIPGHVQQGGLPSPIDRTRAARFAIRAVQFIEDAQDKLESIKYSIEFDNQDTEISKTATVLGIKKSRVVFTPIRKLYDFETQLGKRMPKVISWAHARDVADQLAGRSRLDSFK